MKRILIVILSVFLANAACCQVTKGYTECLEARFGVRKLATLKNKGFTPIEFVSTPGYNFSSKFSAHANAELAVSLFKENGVKDHYKRGTLGLGC